MTERPLAIGMVRRAARLLAPTALFAGLAGAAAAGTAPDADPSANSPGEPSAEATAGPAAEATATGDLWAELRVFTSPPGAEVWLDGSHTGLLTPARLTRVAPGIRDVEVRLRGFANDKRQVSAVARREITVVIPLAGAVALAVDGMWPGASVYVDGRRTAVEGGTVRASPGRRQVRVTHFCTHPVTVETEIGPGERTRIRVEQLARPRWRQAWPSILLPGLAQELQGRRRVAAVFLAAAAAGGGAAVWRQARADAAYREYLRIPRTSSPARQAESQDKFQREDRIASLCGAVLGAVWAGSVAEAYWRAPRAAPTGNSAEMRRVAFFASARGEAPGAGARLAF